MRVYVLNMKENNCGSIEKYRLFLLTVTELHHTILKKGVISSKK